MGITFISHEDCLLHDLGPGHPECPKRLEVIQKAVFDKLADEVIYQEAPLITHEQLLYVHSEAYLQFLKHTLPAEGLVFLDPDTGMNPWTLKAAYRSAGAVILGVDLVLSSGANKVFCNVRPPGHHAERNRAMGFCFFNFSVAVILRLSSASASV